MQTIEDLIRTTIEQSIARALAPVLEHLQAVGRQPGALMTLKDVAEFAKVNPETVARWCGSGRLPARKVGRGWRVHRADLDRFLRLQSPAEDDPSEAANRMLGFEGR